METLEELLDAPALCELVPCFVDAGFDDVEFLLSMDREEWDEVLDAVEEEAAAQGVYMRAGHRMQVVQRLKREQVRRQTQKEDEQRRMAEAAAGADGAAGEGGGGGGGGDPHHHVPRPLPGAMHAPGHIDRKDIDARALRGDGGATQVIVLFEGFSCLRQHWMMCLGLSLFSLLAALFLLALSGMSGELDNGEGEERSGGWEFLHVLMIVGFVVAGVTALVGLFAYTRNPEDAHCEPPSCLTDCVNREHPEAGAMACLLACLTCAACQPSDPDGSCCGALCGEDDPDEESCLDSCYRPDCDCDCSCCPTCEDARECCHTAWKILTCQCRIQV